MRIIACALAACATSGVAKGETFRVNFDPARSTSTVTLSILAASATDSTPVNGFFDLKLNTVANPTSVTGRDWGFFAVEPLVLNVNLDFLGALNTTTTNSQTWYAYKNSPFGTMPLNAGQFVFPDLDTVTFGSMAYEAQGLLCSQFTANGVACDGTVNLNVAPITLVDFNGGVSVDGRTVTVTIAIDQTVPVSLVTGGPALGTLRTQINAAGTVVVPVIEGDANGDCSVDFTDLTEVLRFWGQAGWRGDADNSGAVSFPDLTAVLRQWNTACP